MTEKVEWEVVEEAAPKAGPGAGPQAGPKTAAGPALQGLLGPWWRWKLAALLTLGAIGLVLLIALAGAVAVTVAAVALLSLAIARVTHWLRGGSGVPAQRGYGPPHR